MLYYLFKYLDEKFDMLGAGVFQYISFRSGMAMVFSLIISIVIGKSIIAYLRRNQYGEGVRDLGLQGQKEKEGTPTMGGVIILAAIVIPTLLMARFDNVYVVLLLISCVWMGLIGFADDYLKIKRKNKAGLAGKFKLIGQLGLGLIVGLTMYFNQNVVVREYANPDASVQEIVNGQVAFEDVKSTRTTFPFLKHSDFDYKNVVPFLPDNLTWLVYVGIAIFIVMAVSNGANLTDGLDGLAAGTSAIIGIVMALMAYVSSNIAFAQYLDIMFIPNASEMVIFCAAFVGACIGFLWYNSFPAQVFMGDTGSLSLGGIIAVLALTIRKEWLIPICCGVFLIETLSVMVQVSYFKFTKKRFGEGRRIFKMAPLHHHYQKVGVPESKIVARLWIVGLILGIFTLATLKLR